MFDKMKQMMELKKQAEQIKRDLDNTQISIEEVPGIKLSVSASQEFQSVEIDAQHLTADNKKELEADLLRSLKVATKKVQQVAAEKMRGVMPDGFSGM